MPDNIFLDHAPQYWAARLPVIPLRHKDKMPDISAWNLFGQQMPTDLEQMHWLTSFPKGNIGLPLGPTSGICMADIDTNDEELIKAITDILPFSPWARIGKKGMALAYRWSGLRNFKLSSDSGMIFELLGLGNQLVLPPSIHPDTRRPYVANANLWEVLDELQELPSDIDAQLRSALTTAGACLAGSSSTRTSARHGAQAGDRVQSRFHRWLLECLQEAKTDLGNAGERQRNDTLLRVAAKLARHVAAARESWSFFASELATIALEIGLEDSEIRGTLASAWRYGADDPTSWVTTAQEWVYVSGVDRFRHLATGETLSQAAFRTSFGSVSPSPELSINSFLTDNDYLEKVQNLAFDPTRSPGIYEENGLKWLNTYRPSNVVSVEGDATPFKDFIEYLVPDELERTHLLKMFAQLVQKPGEKLGHALILGSREHGIGKSMLMEILFELLGEQNCRKASSEELESQFNSYIEGTQLVLIEEINLGAGGRKVYNKLKDQITSDVTPMRRLYQDARPVRNVASFIFLTNLDRPLLIDKEDRRYFVLNSPAEPRENAYYVGFNEWRRANIGVIRHFLEQVDLTGFNRKARPPMTQAKTMLIKGSETPIVQELREMLEERHAPFRVDVVTSRQIIEAIRCRLPSVSRNAITDAVRDIDAVSLSQHRLGKVAIPVHMLGTTDRPSLWAVRNAKFWQSATSPEVVEEYLAVNGRLVDLPELPPGMSYAPASLLGPVADSTARAGEAWVIELVRSLNKRAEEFVD